MVPLDLKNTLVFVLAGGAGNRLMPLTTNRAKPAVPFGGIYRIIDFTLSNCIHSGLRRIHLLTQYQARSLEEHIRFGWNFLPRRLKQWIICTPPHHVSVGKWYKGTSDAIYHNLDTISDWKPANVIILSGDHVYQMDYRDMLREHIENKAALTIGAVKIPVAEAASFGILEIDDDGRITGFVEKPNENAPEIPGEPGFCLASMGIYIFETDELTRRLEADSEMPEGEGGDFGHHVIPRMLGEVPIYAHAFRGIGGQETPYWRDVGTIEAYFDAHMDLICEQPQLNLYNKDWRTYTLWHNDPPAKTEHGAGPDGAQPEVVDSLLAQGTIVKGAKVRRSILSNLVRVGEGSDVDECIVMRGAKIGRGCKLKRCIVDKWNEVPDGTVIGYDRAEDERRFTVSATGISVIAQRHSWDE